MVETELVEPPAWKINKQDRKSKDDIIISELGPAPSYSRAVPFTLRPSTKT
jgi:hypothetical protein